MLSTLPAPDFPGGGEILYDRTEMERIYQTGRGGFKVRARWRFVPAENLIEIYEIPYTTTAEAIMEEINDVLYESKLIGYPAPFKNKVRTFCQNPGGYVAQENYDNDLAVVNGHSFKDKKSENTNVAILCSHNFSIPFNQPIAYAQKVGELTNMLGDGHIMLISLRVRSPSTLAIQSAAETDSQTPSSASSL